MEFKKVLPVVALSSALVASPFVTQEVNAASSITQVTLSDGEDTFTVDYKDFANAMLFKSGSFYEYFNNANPNIVSVSTNGETFVDYRQFSNYLLFNNQDNQPTLEVLADLQTDSSYTVAESEVDSYKTLKEVSSDGQKVFENQVIPEVISID